jgi:outer membrane biosynthesis protein TonB
VNKAPPAERFVRLSALSLCALVYAGGLVFIFQSLGNQTQHPVSVKAVRLSIAQVELQTAPVPMAPPEAVPKPEVVPEEEADVALEDFVEEAEPKPQPEPVPDLDAPIAQVDQEASTPSFQENSDAVQGWVLEQIEREKYYPSAAERFGLKGIFNLKIVVDETGTIRSAVVLDGNGHRILRQALENMLAKIIGLKYSKPIGEPMGFEVEFEFE